MAERGVRPAAAADVAEIARLQLEIWRTAYATILPAHILGGLTDVDVAAHWSAAVSDPPSAQHRVLVAVEQQWTVGFAAFGPAQDEGLDPAANGLITALLVEPRWGRRGHGSRLLAATVDLLRLDGLSTAVTWLAEQDRASQAFFASAGWEPDGAGRALDAGGRVVNEVRLHAALS